MTKEEAITILENGEWWEIISGVLPHNDAERIELREAVHVAISALSAQQAPLDRSRWKGCPNCKREWGVCAIPTNRFEIRQKGFCVSCGRPLTEEAWKELEGRINGG